MSGQHHFNHKHSEAERGRHVDHDLGFLPYYCTNQKTCNQPLTTTERAGSGHRVRLR